MRVEWLNFPQLGDERGALSVVESEVHVPFEVKRVYWIFATRGDVRRGFHAHRDLQQVAVAVSGSCGILLDDGEQKTNVTLNSPNEGLKINPLIWHEMYEFTENCVLLVFASEVYDESDYIREYEEFRQIVHSPSFR